MNVYDFTVKNANGDDVSLADYKGTVLLINNSATRCGFTPQYDQLQTMYEMYHDQGFTILDFPCNQFANQAPGTIEEIVNFCDATFGLTFPMFDKIEVNGANAHPLYQYLKSQKGFTGFDMDNDEVRAFAQMVAQYDPDYENNSEIKWNFTKFLINKQGDVVARYEPTADLLEIQDAVDHLVRE